MIHRLRTGALWSFLVLSSLSALTTDAGAQGGHHSGGTLAVIEGRVFQPGSGDPLADVLVHDYGSGQSAYSDSDGYYRITAHGGRREIGFFGPGEGWADQVKTIDAPGGVRVLYATMAALGDFVSAPIGSAGGSASYTDEDGNSVQVVVPQGTWTQPYSLSITTIPTYAQSVIADGFHGEQMEVNSAGLPRTVPVVFELLDAAGQVVTDQVTFAQDVTVTLSLRNSPDYPADDYLMSSFLNPATGQFEQHGLALVDSATETVTFQTDHFSEWKVVHIDYFFWCDCTVGFRDLGTREVVRSSGPIVNGKVSSGGTLEIEEGESISSSTTASVGVSAESDEGAAIGAEFGASVSSSGSFTSSRRMSVSAVDGADTPCSGSGKWKLVEVQQGYEVCVSCFPCPPWQDCAEIWVTQDVKVVYECD